MGAHPKRNPADVVVGARLTQHEAAAVDILRGNLARGTWVAGLVRRELDKARADGKI